MAGQLSRNMVTQKKKNNNQSQKSFLAINLQLHILKSVKQLLLLKKRNNENAERKITSSAIHNNMPYISNCLSNWKIKLSHKGLTTNKWSSRSKWVEDEMHFTV
jgi:hypothetical protein